MIRFGRVHEHIGSSDGALRQFVDLCCRWEVGGGAFVSNHFADHTRRTAEGGRHGVVCRWFRK